MLQFPNTSGTGINVGTASIFNIQSFTVACWVHRLGAGTVVSTGAGGQTNSEPIFTGGVAEVDTLGLNCIWFLGYDPSPNKFTADFEDANNGLNHPLTFTATSASFGWPVHVCVTYNNSSSKNTGSWTGYINGIADSSSSILSTTASIRTPDSASRQFACIATTASSSGGRSGAFLGRISEVCIWNTALSPLEVSLLAKSKIIGIPLQIQSASLQGYWPINHATSGSTLTSGATSSVIDRSTQKRHGTPFGTITGFPEYILSYI